MCIETSGVDAAAYNARVVAAGFIQGGASNLLLGEEFHQNRVQIICSKISNGDPALSYRWDRLRMVRTFMELQERKVINLRPIITHIIPFERAAEGYRLLDETPDQALQVVLDFTGQPGA